MLRPFLLLFLLTSCLYGQDGLFPTYDARARALGGTGLAAEGIDAVWTNPAGLAVGNDRVQAAATAEQRFGISELTMASAAATRTFGNGGFGLQLSSFGFDTYRETRVGLGYGRRLSERLTIGGEVVGFATQTEAYAGTFDFTFGLGAQLEIIEELSVGVRVFSPIRVSRFGEDDNLPQLLALGGSYRPNEKVMLSAEVHQDIEQDTRFRAGLEYLPADALRIRLGVATKAAELSFGIGYEITEGVEVSAAAAYHEILGISPVVGIRYVGK